MSPLGAFYKYVSVVDIRRRVLLTKLFGILDILFDNAFVRFRVRIVRIIASGETILNVLTPKERETRCDFKRISGGKVFAIQGMLCG